MDVAKKKTIRFFKHSAQTRAATQKSFKAGNGPHPVVAGEFSGEFPKISCSAHSGGKKTTSDECLLLYKLLIKAIYLNSEACNFLYKSAIQMHLFSFRATGTKILIKSLSHVQFNLNGSRIDLLY